MNYQELTPILADIQTFLQYEGRAWGACSIVPWAAGPSGECFMAVKTRAAHASLGRPFDSLSRPTAALALARVKADFFPVLLRVTELEQEVLFFFHKRSR
jgi:hypothetical protein